MAASVIRMMVVGKVGARLWGSLQPQHCGFRYTRSLTFLQQVNLRHSRLRNCQACFYSTSAPSGDVSLKYKNGRLVLEVPLPSRNEKCLFFLRPMMMTVGDLIAELKREDSGADASVFSKDGDRVAGSTLIDSLLGKDFQLVINNAVYDVRAPEKTVCPSSEHAKELDDMKHVVHLLHTALHQPEHHLLKERQLLEKLDDLKQELSPLEKAKAQLSRTAEFHTSRVLWTGVALLSVQGGALAWLTWWVYSWDVMEPVTYFITYATSMGAFAYYVLTKQDYVYPDAQDRQFLRYFYKAARKKSFNVEEYNKLKDELTQVEEDLRRLRNPNHLQLPMEQIQPKP
ncbi:calcium uniporter protein, mitochondrial [Austrofundulus limnaeus]|uniref:Calcium uniporter protein n=1 Tax=Austrofundulus limnaeus TaxID=52670 RepID=A0A2I4B639_AUSLI|nr:PREDICTED: calcium uniporter regulatory subunit MCUb, mitochondrial [Austrofundulus limnaeus]XP_013863216.1 PREDICTED: calcium uniporter regulatory subunit MCUb, mitochondrial [Austrofundulus limnaeus]